MKKVLEQNFNNQKEVNERLKNDIEKMTETLRELTNENRMLEKRNKEVSLMNTQLTNEKDRLALEKLEAVEEKNLTKAGVSALTREIEYLRSQVNKDKSSIMALVVNKDKMKNEIQTATKKNEEKDEEIKRHENNYDKLAADMAKSK
jgi:chromosome segregation ATPase